MFIKLNRIRNSEAGWYLSEIRLNVSHILFISEDTEIARMLKEGKIDIGLSKSHRFSKIKLSTNNTGYDVITVVGAPELIEGKIYTGSKQLLRG
tara:strand:- start:457 stop:738 length:282 start_codon:yes stop_codon:yes gene_type:complete